MSGRGDRWERLFTDLEAQAAAADRAELDGELPDRTRSARAEVPFTDRLRASLGREVSLRLAGGAAVRGTLRHVALEWLVVLAPDRGTPSLVPTAAVVSGQGLSRHATAASASAVAERLSLRSVLRTVAIDRSPVRLWLTDGRVLGGTLDDVGHDHVDLAEHPLDEPRRPGSVRDTHTVLVSGVALLAPAEGTSSLAW